MTRYLHLCLISAIAVVLAATPALSGDGMPGGPHEACIVGPGVFAKRNCETIREAQAAQYSGLPEDGAQSYWNHNGSMMYLRAEGPFREFYYQAPKRGMLAVGARPGTLLFSGRAMGQRYDGVAYIFSRDCGPLGYRVTGPILDNDSRVLLRGMAPRVNRNCAIIGYRPDLLEFEFIAR